MGRRRAAVLGFFVIAGFITLCLTVIIFIPRFSLDYSKSYVINFQGQLTGLHIGSDVTIRGVKVGQVSRLGFQYDENQKRFNVPVYVNFIRRRSKKFANHVLISKLIKEGLRAELHIQNFLTGNAVIELEFRPGSNGYVVEYNNPKYLEIPSVPDNEKQPDFRTAINSAKEMFDSINILAKSPKIPDALEAVKGAADSTKILVTNANAKLPGTLEAVKNAAHSTTVLTTSFNDHLPAMSNSFTEGFNEIKSSAYSVRSLSEFLSRHPESLIKGKNASARR